MFVVLLLLEVAVLTRDAWLMYVPTVAVAAGDAPRAVSTTPAFPFPTLTLRDTPYRTFRIDLIREQVVRLPTQHLLAGRMVALPNLNEIVFTTQGQTFALDRTRFEDLVTRATAALTTARHDVALSQADDGSIVFSDVAVPEYRVDLPLLLTRTITALTAGTTSVDLPYRTVQPIVAVDRRLADRGITDFLGTSFMSYVGSAPERAHNVQMAAKKLTGTIIPRGATWSFNDALFPLSVRDFQPAHVIQGGSLVDELGGGVCQVSSAIFRAALAAGLTITERRPHSLRLPFYDPPGLDAAVYPGQKDLRITNTTSGDVLLQATTQGETIRVNFFGTRDGSSIHLIGPLAPDGATLTEIADSRRDFLWKRELTLPDGKQRTEEYRANY